MKKIIYIMLLWKILIPDLICQNYIFNSGQLTIELVAPLDTVSAVSDKMNAILNIKTNEVYFECKVESLKFENQLILTNLSKTILNVKEHPKIIFKGKVDELNDNPNEPGVPTEIYGTLSFNGVDRNFDAYGYSQFDKVKNHQRISFKSRVHLSDFNIVIPSVLRDAISNTVYIDFVIEMRPSEKLTKSRR